MEICCLTGMVGGDGGGVAFKMSTGKGAYTDIDDLSHFKPFHPPHFHHAVEEDVEGVSSPS